MDDVRLPCHVIDRLEHRWANRLQQTRRHGAARTSRSVRLRHVRSTVRETSPSPSDAPVVLRMP